MNKFYLTTIALSCMVSSTSLHAEDWTMWAGSLERNMVNTTEKNLPSVWDVDSGKNIKWKVDLGSQSYGNPVIHKGRIFVGTNNEHMRNPEIKGDKGIVMCFKEDDGSFLWQAVHDKLEAGRVNDWPLQGICSSPAAEGDRIYYVNNRCEVVCADTEGFHDGENDGWKDETYASKLDADIVWKYDMIEELGVFPHNLATSSPLIYEDLILIVTGNGVDEGHLNIPSPASPSFIAINKKTGELVWESNLPGKNVLHGQWSSPAVGNLHGKTQAIFPGGDGFVYSLNPKTGTMNWKFDCNPEGSVWELGGYGTKNNLIATPVIHDGSVFIGVGQDPEHGTSIGHLYRIDGAGEGDVTATAKKWHVGGKDFGRTMSTAAIKDDIMYICDLSGYLYCFNAKTGERNWRYDLTSAVWSSPIIADGKVYIGDEDGDVCVLKHTAEKPVVINEMNMGSAVYTTPSPANGVLYIATKSQLFAIVAGAN
jgi:outer membrane protein assembly factor BamB